MGSAKWQPSFSSIRGIKWFCTPATDREHKRCGPPFLALRRSQSATWQAASPYPQSRSDKYLPQVAVNTRRLKFYASLYLMPIRIR